MGQLGQSQPIALGELPLVVRHRRVGRDRAIAGEDPLAEKVVRTLVGAELEVAVEESVGDTLLEGVHEVVDVNDLDDAPQLAGAGRAATRPSDDPEQPIPANRRPEELAVLPAAAAA